MKRFDQNSATCQVFTYKEGLFSALAHDLRINVTHFIIELSDDDASIDGRFDALSLHVDCAMVDGVERRDLLSAVSLKEIDENIVKDVLDAATYRSISFDSTSVTKENSTYRISGILTLRGNDRAILFTVRKEGEHHIAETWLHLPDFGIKPFSALFGTIKIKPDVLIRITVIRAKEGLLVMG